MFDRSFSRGHRPVVISHSVYEGALKAREGGRIYLFRIKQWKAIGWVIFRSELRINDSDFHAICLLVVFADSDFHAVRSLSLTTVTFMLPACSLSLRKGPSIIRQCRRAVWQNIQLPYGSSQTLLSPSDSILCMMRMAHAAFLSDTTHCPMVTSRSICRTTMPDNDTGSYPWSAITMVGATRQKKNTLEW